MGFGDIAELKGYSIGNCPQALTYRHHADINNTFPLSFMLSVELKCSLCLSQKTKYQICELELCSFLSLELASLCNCRQTQHHFTVLANSSSSCQLLISRWQASLYNCLNKAEDLSLGVRWCFLVISTVMCQCLFSPNGKWGLV